MARSRDQVTAERAARHALAMAKGPTKPMATIITPRSASANGKIAVVRFDGATRNSRIFDLTGAGAGKRVYVDAQPGGASVISAIAF